MQHARAFMASCAASSCCSVAVPPLKSACARASSAQGTDVQASAGSTVLPTATSQASRAANIASRALISPSSSVASRCAAMRASPRDSRRLCSLYAATSCAACSCSKKIFLGGRGMQGMSFECICHSHQHVLYHAGACNSICAHANASTTTGDMHITRA